MGRLRRMALAALVLTLAAQGGAAPDARPAASARRPLIWIDLDLKRLTLYENGAEAAVYPIASGTAQTPSPVGVFRISGRFATELSGFGTRFLGLSVPWGSYGIHGTNKPGSIGQNASHGCIRLRVKDAEALYRAVPNGVSVVLDGGPYGPMNAGYRVLREGDRGADVFQLQLRLIQRGFLFGWPDGVFGPNTGKAVAAARRACSLPPGDADAALQRTLGMILFE